MHNARSSVMWRIGGVGSSREANKVHATAAKAMAPEPSGHAVAIQKNAHMLIATPAANADNSAMPGSVCIGLGPISAAAARMFALGVGAGSVRLAAEAVVACQAAVGSIDRTQMLTTASAVQVVGGLTGGVGAPQACLRPGGRGWEVGNVEFSQLAAAT